MDTYERVTSGDESRTPAPPANGTVYSPEEVWTELVQGTPMACFQGKVDKRFDLIRTKQAIELMKEGQSYRRAAELSGIGVSRISQIRAHISPFLPPPSLGGGSHHKSALKTGLDARATNEAAA